MMSHNLLCTFILLYVMLQNEKGTVAFKIIFGTSVTHQEITQRAILLKTAEVCKALAIQQGKDFVQPSVLTVESLTKACSFPESAKGFQQAITKICSGNALVESEHEYHAEYHFNSEEFLKGRDLITEGVKAVKASAKLRNYETAREKLGTTLHTLQDFYSHSNWIELGNKFPYPNLIRPDSIIENIADLYQPTCRSCDGVICRNNILEGIILDKKLTSGYFGVSKPSGKCSHGDSGDISSGQDPKGGINKDEPSSSHGYLHRDAANMAIAATKELLEDIRGVVGDSSFLRLMGFSQDSVLCFVIDTTGSMGNDIAEVQRVTAYIIQSKKGTPNEPLEYIMVPFNDPGFGPLYRTTNSDEFIKQINALGASGGGDEPELCLSGLQLALTGSPPKTEVFVFTDASAKDSYLENTVKALIESTKSVVNFFLTKVLSARRRRGVDTDQKQILSSRALPSKTVYVNLALASGGQVIEVTKATLSQATSIIVDSSTSSLVTVFQVARNPGKVESFSFIVDPSIQNLTIYITGSSLVFNITSPSGHFQTNNELSGELGLIKQVGNFYTVRLTAADLVGMWNIHMNSLQSYSIKVVGQSDVDFLFTFVELTEGAHSAYRELSGRPLANSNITLFLTMVGGDSVTPTEVALVDALGSQIITGTVEKVTGRDYLVTMTSVPAGEFVVRLMAKGTTLRSSGSVIQRQSVTQFKASSVDITAQTDEVWEPGETLSIPFTVMHNSANQLNINARNDLKFGMSFPTTVLITSGSGNGAVSITAPSSTPSGTEVTLTFEATTTSGDDFNYAVLKLSVVAPITDFTPPVCEIVSISADCSSNCSLSSWEVRANLTDGSGTGILTVTVRQGLGILSTSTTLGDGGVTIIQAYYRASCCSQEMELVAVDGAGNVGTCTQSIRPTVSPTSNTILPSTATSNTPSPTFTTTQNTSSTSTTTSNTILPTFTSTPNSLSTLTKTSNTLLTTFTATSNTLLYTSTATPHTSSTLTTTSNTLLYTSTATPHTSSTPTTTSNTLLYTSTATPHTSSTLTTTSNTLLSTSTVTPNTSSTLTTTSSTLLYSSTAAPNTSSTLTTTSSTLLYSSTAAPNTSSTLTTASNIISSTSTATPNTSSTLTTTSNTLSPNLTTASNTLSSTLTTTPNTSSTQTTTFSIISSTSTATPNISSTLTTTSNIITSTSTATPNISSTLTTTSNTLSPSLTTTSKTLSSTFTTTPNTSSPPTKTYNTSLSAFTTTNFTATTFFPFTNATTSSAGHPLYAFWWVTVGAIMFSMHYASNCFDCCTSY